MRIGDVLTIIVATSIIFILALILVFLVDRFIFTKIYRRNHKISVIKKINIRRSI
jgi:hypothetical protein